MPPSLGQLLGPLSKQAWILRGHTVVNTLAPNSPTPFSGGLSEGLLPHTWLEREHSMVSGARGPQFHCFWVPFLLQQCHGN